MDFDEDYRFALDCEINPDYRRCDGLRSQMLQLVAHRKTIPIGFYRSRFHDLLAQYSLEVDKEKGCNTFIDSAVHIVKKESQRECKSHKWQSGLKKKLDEGMTITDLLSSVSPHLETYLKVLEKKQNVEDSQHSNQSGSYVEKKPNSQSLPEINQDTEKLSQNSKESIKFINSQEKSSNFSSPKNSSKFISGLFKNSPKRKKISPSTLSESSTRNSSQESVNSVENFKKPQKPSSFVSAFEINVLNQVVENRLTALEAKKLIDEQKNVKSFKKSSSKSDTMISGGNLIKLEELKGIEQEMIESILAEIINKSGSVDWSKIAGLDYAKAKIQRIAILPLKRPDLFTGIRSPPKGILLFGPPGTGKTMIGRCIASQANANFFSITSSSLTSKWIGDGEKAMKVLFVVARYLKPSVIFIDEIDSLLQTRSNSEHESSRRMKTEFLSQFDGLANESNDGVLVIGTTNRPQDLDEAVRRRFAAKLYISLPEKEARKQMILNNLENEKHCLTNDQIDDLADRTTGYSGSDIANLCSDAAMYSLEEIEENLSNVSKDQIRPISYEDFKESLEIVKPSFFTEDLKEYESWNKKFGSNFRK